MQMTDENVNTSKNPSIDKWVWLLKRTLYKNNWSHLREGFISDESYLRKLADMMDFMKDEANNVHPHNLARQSMMQSQNPLYEFRQNFAKEMYKQGRATKGDAELVISMFNRAVTFKEENDELFELVRDSFNRRKTEDKVNSLDQAFQLKRLNLGRPEPEYIVPKNIKRLVTIINDEDLSMNGAINELAKDAKTLSWSANKYQEQMNRYKYTALNDYLLDRMEKGRTILDGKERQRIKRIWKIDMPKELLTYPIFIELGIGRLGGKDGAKTVAAEVIKANRNLH
jgi:hypothetical protein